MSAATPPAGAPAGAGLDRGIFLVGMMGAGKTTIGQCIGSLLGSEFLDADWELERRAGRTIEALFGEGEAAFRLREAELLDELTRRRGIVLATGGGAVLRADNRAALGGRGLVVYLHAVPARLWERARVQGGRPLLRVADPLRRLTELYAQRDPLYRECADLVLETAGATPMELADLVVASIARVVEEMGLAGPGAA
ncbi:shikimate kinase [Burkholderia plantarii]|uniref:shikimate kinase n=1 Tax=Burkholderia plantarii TaxID=41899 RepID=UPI001F5BA606|nr:shikimate kinase [Burkholderia plantarii]